MAKWNSTVEDRFWKKVARGKADACWPWTAAHDPRGYGVFYDGRKLPAHRYSWTLANGPIPNGLLVLHRCDNPPCVNPDHLFLGTQLDNIHDCLAKGRGRRAKGDRHWNVKLNDSDVIAIRASNDTPKSLALHYGVTRNHIYGIRSGRHR